jgi:hypothetical protein
MRDPRLRAIALVAVVALATAGTGCVTSRVHVNDPDARVWVDGRRVVPGQRFWGVGPPHRAEVRVATPDGREVRARLSRQFGFGTLMLGFYSFGVCWVMCWSYPDELTVILPPRPAPTWDAVPNADPWSHPPPGWSPPVLAPASAPETKPDPWSAPPSN